jgi:predicted signal transduction protein with EAL and GGDEF domain
VADELREGRWVSGTIQDVTEQMRTQEKIRLLANFDSLTGLANRRFFKDQFARALAAARSKGHSVGLLFMDLDRFKQVNDTLGHRAGDALLQHVADRLREHVRGSDMVARDGGESPAPEISRLGGDEFTVLLSKISKPEDAGDVARRVLRVLPQPVRIEGTEVSARISIGIATYPLDGEDVDTLMRNADVAMYHAKERGRNTYEFFSDSMNAASLRKLTLESRLGEALERGELRLHYQPRFDLATREMVACEALLRWHHPELGTVSPAEFIPVSEECGLIHAIGDWVLRVACAQNKAWQDAGYQPLPISVNVSTRQFIERDLREIVATALTEADLAPEHLEIEITENALMHDDEGTAIAFRDLQSMGVRIALDDFGTGYSSLSYITHFPLDVLKMDRAFVRDVDSDPAAKGVTNAVIQMAHSLGLRVVAEGVDSDAQAQILREQGCDELQGFLLSAAVPPEELVRFLRRG